MYKGPKRKFKRTGKTKLGEYGLQLVEKQKLRKAYGVREKTLKRYFLLSSSKRVSVDKGLVEELERRLDNVLYRLGWAHTRPQAAQLVSHGHVLVNLKRVTVPSYQVRRGDKIQVKENKKKLPIFLHLDQRLAKHTSPEWLTFSSQDKMNAEVIGEPQKGDFTEPINLSLVLEFYSR